jgi:hypothetical protein
MHKYIAHVHVWLFLKIVQLNSLIMSYVHQLGIWSSDYCTCIFELYVIVCIPLVTHVLCQRV